MKLSGNTILLVITSAFCGAHSNKPIGKMFRLSVVKATVSFEGFSPQRASNDQIASATTGFRVQRHGDDKTVNQLEEVRGVRHDGY